MDSEWLEMRLVEMVVQALDEGMDSEWLEMRSVAVVEAQEAMTSGVSVRDNGPTDFLASGVMRRETAPGT
jgi:hypothetical protein